MQTKAVVQLAIDKADLSISDAAKHFGLGCPLPATLQIPIHAIISTPDDAQPSPFVVAIRQNIIAGGDNCSRAAVFPPLLFFFETECI